MGLCSVTILPATFRVGPARLSIFPEPSRRASIWPTPGQLIASAMEDLGQGLLEEGKPLPTPRPDAVADADLIELVPLSVYVGAPRG